MFSRPSSPSKKTFYYTFFPTKEEEESQNLKQLELGRSRINRIMVEIRDIDPPLVVDPTNPWRIKKTLNQYEINSRKLVLTWKDMFEHVVRYWTLGWARYLGLGSRVDVAVWDVTQEDCPRKYDEINGAYLKMGEGDEVHLTCMELMVDRNLKVYDEIELYWDNIEFCFMFRLLL